MKDLLLESHVYEWESAVHRAGNLDFIPAGVNLDIIWRSVAWSRLESIIRNMEKYDIVLVDGPAQFEEGFIGVMKVAEYYVIVLTPTPGSIESAIKIRFAARKLGTKPLGFILNQPNISIRNVYDVARLVEKKMYLPSLGPEHANCRCLGVLPYDKTEFISRVRGKPIVVYEPRSKLSKALYGLSLKIEGRPVRKKALLSKIANLFSHKHLAR